MYLAIITICQLMIQPLRYINQHRLLRGLLFCSITVALTACGGGETGTEGPDVGVIDYPIAYVKRPTPLDTQAMPPVPAQEDTTDPLFFGAGGDLYLRNRASVSASETNITNGITGGTGDVKDVDVSYDGTKLVFALRLEDLAPNDDTIPPPTWNIYEYDVTTKQLRRVIQDDLTAEEGDDIDPHFLADGRIIFSSTRQQHSKKLRVDEGPINNIDTHNFSALDEARNNNAFVLHIMADDGSNIKQVSFNESHDLDPVVLTSGEIIFSRWDNASGLNNGFSLYKMTPDGGQLQIMYGGHSHATGTSSNVPIAFTQPRQMPDGRLLVIAKPTTGSYGGGDIFTIDINGHIDFNRSTSGALLAGGQISTTPSQVTTDGSLSLGGRYISAFPLWDGSDRILVSKGLCQILVNNEKRICTTDLIAQNPTAPEVPPAYNIWMFNPNNNTEKLIVPAEENMMIADVVALQPRNLPAIISGPAVDCTDPLVECVGWLHIRSVYDFDGSYFDYGSGIPDIQTMANAATPADERPARFIRLIKPVGIPDPDDDPNLPDLDGTAFGPNRNLGMRQILGYAPVEPDGSVMVKVPANVPFSIEVLDAQGKRIGARHRNWLQLEAGETRECNGCHSHPNNTATPLPHGRIDAGLQAVNQGEENSWYYISLGTNPFIFAFPGETLAQARLGRCDTTSPFSSGCLSSAPTAGRFEPTLDVLYEDNVWYGTNADISYSYLDLTTPAPVSVNCQTAWQEECRIIINYEQHIHPLWSATRDLGMGTFTCQSCHNATTAGDNDPATGFLDLSDGFSGAVPTQYNSYRELLFSKDVLADLGNTDINGNPILDTITVNPTMSVGGARASNAFFSRFETGGIHEGYLTPAELRLIAEWLDIGAQYFNNPSDPDVPVN
jgi:hypothetical protein